MKKILVTILAFVYLSGSMGAVLHLHYCMGKLVSIGLVDKDGSNCQACGMSKSNSDAGFVTTKKNCCNDKHLQIKTDKDQKLVQSESQSLKLLPESFAGNLQKPVNCRMVSVTIRYPNTNSPPQSGKPPVFLLNRNFRI